MSIEVPCNSFVEGLWVVRMRHKKVEEILTLTHLGEFGRQRGGNSRRRVGSNTSLRTRESEAKF